VVTQLAVAVRTACRSSPRADLVARLHRLPADDADGRAGRLLCTTLIGGAVGLRSADRSALDVVRAYGGGRWQQLVRVRAIAALPSTVAALKIAAPAALLGAIIGEYLGRVDAGPGRPAVTISEQQLEVARTWGIALVAGALAGVRVRADRLAGGSRCPGREVTTVDGTR